MVKRVFVVSRRIIEWQYLRQKVRERSASNGLRTSASMISGVSAPTLCRFLRGEECDIKSFLGLLEYSGLPVQEVIVEESLQLSMLDRSPVEKA